jgi:hypothetical protein
VVVPERASGVSRSSAAVIPDWTARMLSALFQLASAAPGQIYRGRLGGARVLKSV